MYNPFILINMGKILQYYLDDDANNSLFDFCKRCFNQRKQIITPTIMRRVLYIRALKNKVRSYISKSLWKDF